MKRFCFIIFPLVAVIFGVIGGLTRRRELAEAFDEGGLPITGHPTTTALILLSAVFVALLIIAALLSVKKTGGYDTYFTGGKASGALELLSGAALVLSAALGVMNLSGDTFLTVVLFLSVLAGLCVCCHGVFCMSGREGEPPSALLLIPVFCLCVRLIFVFKGWSADPTIVDYIYRLLSVILITVCLFFTCGFVFDAPKPRLTAAAALCGVYFSALTLFEYSQPTDLLFSGFAALYMFALAMRMLGPQKETVSL